MEKRELALLRGVYHGVRFQFAGYLGANSEERGGIEGEGNHP